MKRKSLKRALVTALMTTMVFASTLTVEAASGGSAGSSGSGSSGTKSESSKPQEREETRERTGNAVNSVPGEVAGSVSGVTEVFSNVTTVSAGGTVTVAGTAVKSTIAGAAIVKSLRGAAVITPLADVKASLGLKNGQTPFVMTYDTDAKKSPLAMKCVDAAIEAEGGTLVTAINVDLSAKENGKIVSLKNGSAAMAVGLPKNVDVKKTYYVVCVQPGGVISILQDQDTNPNTVTFEIKAGLGTYALAMK